MRPTSSSRNLTTRQAAELVGKSQSYIKLLCQYGQLKAKKFGRDWYISQTSLLEYFPEAKQPAEENGK